MTGGGSGVPAGLIEREPELARIDALVAELGTGQGSTLLIEGAPGIGKTALLEAARERAGGDGVTALDARAASLEGELAFGVVRQLFEPLVRGLEPGERERLLAGAAGLSEGPLGVAPEPARATEPPSPDSALHGLYWLCANLADRGPLLIAIDDLQWADEPSLRFLSYLVRRASEHPLLVVATSRPPAGDAGEVLASTLGDGWAHELRPGPLSEAGVELVVRRTLSDDAEREFCAACADATGGNPFLLAEALRALRADRVDPVAAEAGQVDGLRAETLSRALLARLARLGEAATAVSHALAALGGGEELRRVARLAELAPEDAAEAVEGLRREGILAPGRELEFEHPLIRNAVEDDLGQPALGLAHLGAARLLRDEGESPERIARLLLASEPSGEAWVVETLRAAAAASLGRAAPGTASRYLRRALEEPPAAEARPELLLEAGFAATRAGEPDAFALMREAVELGEDVDARAAAAARLGPALHMAGRVDEAVDVCERALEGLESEELRAPLETLELLAGMTTISACRRMRPRLREVPTRVAEAPIDEQPGLLLALAALEVASTGGTAAEAAELAERMLSSTHLIAGAMEGALLPYAAAWTLARVGRPGAARPAMDALAAEAREHGSSYGLAAALANGSFARLRTGDLRGADADATIALDLAEEGGLGVSVTVAATVVTTVLVERDDLRGAREVMDRVDAGPYDLDQMPHLPLREARAKLALAEGDPAAALAELRPFPRWEDVHGSGTVYPVAWRSWAAQAELARDRADEARRLAGEEVEIARRFADPRQLGVALRVAGLCERGERRTELLAEAVTALEGSEDRLEHARVLADHGAALRRAHRRAEARERLAAGMDMAHRIGATALAERAREELRIAGARPRRLAFSGRESLTAAELRVAELAAAGNSNREIAQALFVTLRTVETHLTAAYRKLDIDSREGLAGALAAAPG